MTMAFVVEGVRDYLRDNAPWTKYQCSIQHGAMPPSVATEIHIAIDAGPITTAPENSYYLGETSEIIIGVWKRWKDVPRDRTGTMLVETDIYRAAVATLHSEERTAVKLLHKSFAAMGAINTQFSLPDASKGDAFQSPLHYMGNSGNETMVVVDAQEAAFLGRKLRFRGLLRIQYVDSIG